MPPIDTLLLILGMGLLMAAIALSGSLTLVLPAAVLERALKPLVAFAAGSLLGGALFHMLPHALGADPRALGPWLGLVAGFAAFMVLDQVLEWHHGHRSFGPACTSSLPWLVLAADTLHNLLGGLAIGAMFVTDPAAGFSAWVAGALHEVPQELGDFAVLVHAGWPTRRALAWNLASALTFPVGGALAWLLGGAVDTHLLVAFGAGSFLYIATVDLLPEIKRASRLTEAAARFGAFALGVALLVATRAGESM